MDRPERSKIALVSHLGASRTILTLVMLAAPLIAAAHCPDRDAPKSIEMWEPQSGWRTIALR